MNRLSKTVFRSLLRWNRKNAPLGVPFQISPAHLKLSALQPTPALPPIIDSYETLHGLVFHAFRTVPYSEASIDVGLNAVKVLNNLSLALKEKSLLRETHQNPTFSDHALFKVGQIVQHKYSNVRGVVVGWEVDASRNKQRVQWLVDLVDHGEFSNPKEKFSKFVDAEHLQLVEDRHLQRIHNTGVNSLFYYFDSSCSRYVPKIDLQYLYPCDFQDVIFQNEFLHNENQAMTHRALSGIETLGKHLQFIVDEYFVGLVDESPLDSPVAQREYQLARDILGDLLQSIHAMTDTTRHHQEAEKEAVTYSRKIARGPHILTQQQQQSQSRQQFKEVVVFPIDQQREIERVYGALFSTQEFVSSLYQLIQLRFQSNGTTFCDRLQVLPIDPSQSHSQSAQRAEPYLSAASANQLIAQPLHPDVAALENQAHYPIAIFEVGQVIRHKQYGYRGVISGYDHRPIIDVSKWDAVKDLKLKQEQPFYRVIPDQRDTEDFLGEGAFRPYFYVAQENVELVTDPAQMIVQHRSLNTYFQGWDMNTMRFRLPNSMKYCFPCGVYAISENYPVVTPLKAFEAFITKESQAAAPNQVSDEQQQQWAAIREELATFDKMDMLLLELMEQTKRVLSAIREDHELNSTRRLANEMESNSSLFTVRDLFSLLRMAPSLDAAVPVESVSWFVWLAHQDVNLSTLMRLGMSFTKRNDKPNAIACYKLAVQLNPRFSEAHNKLAAIYHSLDMHDECLQSARQALECFPEHYGALAGMGLSYEKLGDGAKAIECIRQALNLHPFAANLPTVLHSILRFPKAADSQNTTGASGATAATVQEVANDGGHTSPTAPSS